MMSLDFDEEQQVHNLSIISDSRYAIMGWHNERTGDRIANHAALSVTGMVILASVCGLIGGGALISAISGTAMSSCLVLRLVGGAAIGLSCASIVLLALLAIHLCRKASLSTYGACCFPPGRSPGDVLVRCVLTGALPFTALLVLVALDPSRFFRSQRRSLTSRRTTRR
jgi:hypothetical protein